MNIACPECQGTCITLKQKLRGTYMETDQHCSRGITYRYSVGRLPTWEYGVHTTTLKRWLMGSPSKKELVMYIILTGVLIITIIGMAV